MTSESRPEPVVAVIDGFAPAAVEPLMPEPTIPQPPPNLVERPRLFELLDQAVTHPLTLVSAPAGWGKTTLLAAWVRAGRAPGPVAWFTAEAGGSADFWDHFAAALSAVEPVACRAADRQGTIDEIVTALEVPGPLVVVVVDDAHEVTDAQVWTELETALGRAATRLRLVLGCRADPALPLYRWRMRGAVTEIRNAQLAFSLAETGRLLAAHDVRLAEPALVGLHAMTEGWAAGLRLAALAISDHPDPDSLVPEFAVHDRALGEYLVGEVLDKLAEDIREVLLATSVLDQVRPELVQALTGRTDGERILAELEQANLLAAHGTGSRGWYRCHPLFGLMLYNELRHHRPERLPELHRRAAEWYFAHDMPADAIRHALAAGEWGQAVAVVDSSWHELVPGARLRTLKEVVPTPPQQVQQDPRLALAFAAERLDASDPRATEMFLHLVDRSQHACADDATRDRLRPILAAFRVAEAHLSGDPELVLATAPLLLRDDVPVSEGDSHQVRSLALVAMGGARLNQGDLQAAEAPLEEGLVHARRSGVAQAQIASLRQLAALHATRGQLNAAVRFAKEAVSLADQHGLTQGSDLVWTLLTLADVCHQQNRVRPAMYYLERAVNSGGLVDPGMVAAAAIVRARLEAATGDVPAAAAELSVVRRQLVDCQISALLWHSLTLAEAELHVQAGEPAAAKRLLGVPPPDLLSVWFTLVQAKVHLAERRPSPAASAVVAHLEPGGGSLLWTVEANLTYARAMRALGDRTKAGRSVEQALRLADEEGIRRPFLEGGHAVRELLTTYVPAGSSYRGLADDLAGDLAQGAARQNIAVSRLPEPLTERELTVLRYLQSMLSAAEIASMLCVSVNTVKTHMKSIYRKLGAGRRREVIQRARELNLL
ncbi:MAG TPA: LuxR C-terminal-related transcriptional regulator [Planosporangium sp.]|jgi:LuxR family maltose regulon positive regulatory protein|nr:LuxR C-terminal-related transcriptional regulator [Planosporangium sp.]